MSPLGSDLHHILTPDGTTLAVRELHGSGQPILALHGFTGDGSTMMPMIEALREHRPALLVDLVGHGQSDAPETLDPYTMASVVDQALFLVGGYPTQTVHVVGYSMGGRVALSMAARAPWHFASMTVLSSTAGITEPEARSARHHADLALADRIEPIGVDAFIDEWLANPMFAPLVDHLGPAGLAQTKAQRTAASATGLAQSLRGSGTGAMAPVWDSLAGLQTPLLALAGDLDQKYVELAHRLADVVPHGRSEIIHNAGHALPLENPEVVATSIAQHLEGCENSSTTDSRS